ncbi:MAG: hypothetical protein LBS84_01195, partial [Clostridiales bacterium]|nr:hypothetical protein [Clostridiales bacterium]
MKRILSVLSTASLIAAMLSGCGNSAGTQTPASASASQTAEAAKPADASEASESNAEAPADSRPHIKLTAPSFPSGAGADSYIEKWLEDKFNIDLEIVALPSDQDDRGTQINLMMSDQNLMPDIIWFDSKNAKEYEQWRDNGMLVDLYPLIKEYGQDLVTHYADTDQLTALFSTYEKGKMYRLIADVSEPGSTSTIVRADWMKNFGIDSISTIDEYVDYLRKCVKEDPDGDGQANTVGLTGPVWEDMMALYPFWGAYGVYPEEWFIQPDGSIKYGMLLPETKEALAAISAAYQEGLIDSNLITNAKDFHAELWPEGKSSSFYTWSYFLTPGYAPGTDFKNKNPSGEYIRIEPVSGPNGFKSDRPSDPFGSGYIAITSKCADPVAAFRLLNGIEEPLTSIMIKNGEAGVDYNMVEGNIELLTDKEAQDAKGIGILTLFMERKDKYNIEIGIEGNERFAAGQEASTPLREK